MGKRSVLLLVSVLIAALGTALIFVYVRTANDRAVEGKALVQMNVAKTDIPANTTIDGANVSQYFTFVEVPRDTVPAGIVADLTVLVGKTVQTAVYAGDPIQTKRFGDAVAVAPVGIKDFGHSLVIPDPQRVAPYIKPGSTMAAFYTTGSGSGLVTKVLSPSVRVIAIGNVKADGSAVDPTAAGLPQQLVTLDLPQEMLEKFITVEAAGATITLAAIGGKTPNPKSTFNASEL